MNHIVEFHQCANCGACYNSCPGDAIRVDGGSLFYRVIVDEEKCIGCGKCVQVCPVGKPEQHQHLLSAYYTIHRDKNIVKHSSSGGAFSAMADWILRQGGVIFGACYSGGWSQVLFCSSDQVSMDELRRSKYVESRVGTVFRDIKDQLVQGRKVLFCGTPCQVAGLLRFLGRENENLYTCDFSCGGLPSHEIYQEYLQNLRQRYGSGISDVNFRPKTLGWETYAVKVSFENGKVYNSPAVPDPYLSVFLGKHYSVRDNCLDCRELNLEDASYNMKRKTRSDAFFTRREDFLEHFRTDGLHGAKNCLEMPTGIQKLAVICKSAIKKILWSVK